MYKYRFTQKDKWLNILFFSSFSIHCHCYKLILTFFWLASSSVLFLRHYFLSPPFHWCILYSLVYRNHCSFIHLLVASFQDENESLTRLLSQFLLTWQIRKTISYEAKQYELKCYIRNNEDEDISLKNL